ncbi:MAG: DUF4430 domain-containing protein [Actinomycetia bacterium]|nr:DUF4430 domain-containing protein [Actinomycetes bacterium]
MSETRTITNKIGQLLSDKPEIWVALASCSLLLISLLGFGLTHGWFAVAANPVDEVQLQDRTEHATSAVPKTDKVKAVTIDKKDEEAGAPSDSNTSRTGQVDAESSSAATTLETSAQTPSGSDPSTSQLTTPAPAPTVQTPPPPPPAPSTITVSVYVDSSAAAGFGYPACMASTTVTLPQDSTVYDALCMSGVGIGGSSNYVSSINGLAEFSCGAGSGWLYYVNGSSPGFGCDAYILSGGESITWLYTLSGWY